MVENRSSLGKTGLLTTAFDFITLVAQTQQNLLLF